VGKKKHLMIFGILIGVLSLSLSAFAAPPVCKVCKPPKVENVPPIDSPTAKTVLAALADHTGMAHTDPNSGKVTLFLWPSTEKIASTTYLDESTVRAIYVFDQRPGYDAIQRVYLYDPDRTAWGPHYRLAYASADYKQTHPLSHVRQRFR